MLMRSTTRLQVLSAKVSADERAQLDALAQLERTTVSTLTRLLLVAAVRERVRKLTPEQMTA